MATYHRRFYTTSALNIPSFIMTFSGTFPAGYPDASSALLDSQLKVYIRRISSPTGNYGPTANPLALHGSLYNSGVFDDNGTTDTAATAIRTTNTGNAISATFGGFPANTGFYRAVGNRSAMCRWACGPRSRCRPLGCAASARSVAHRAP